MNTQYVKRQSTVIEAFQLTRETRRSNADWPSWMNKAWNLPRRKTNSLYPTIPNTSTGILSVMTQTGEHRVSFGDWIIRDDEGNLEKCGNHIFELTYKRVESDA